MSKVIVRSTNCSSFVSKKSGVQWFQQSIALDNGADFPQPTNLLLDDPKKALPPGEYVFAPDALYVNDNGDIVADKRKLVPISKVKAA